MNVFIPNWVIYCAIMWVMIGVGLFILSLENNDISKFVFTKRIFILLNSILFWPIIVIMN